MFWTVEISLLLGAYAVNLSRVSMLSAQSTECLNWMPGNHYCDWQCNSRDFEFDGGDCTDPPKVCPAKWIGDAVCQPLCDTVALFSDGGDCGIKSKCLERMLGNEYCDWQCNTKEHNFDDGACDTAPVLDEKCEAWMRGNGYCDDACDTVSYDWDGGDCEDDPVVCQARLIGNGVCDEVCDTEEWEWDGGECIKKTGCLPFMLGNHYCDPQCNIDDFGFDGGDCVKCDSGYTNVAGICILNCDSVAKDGKCDADCNTAEHHFDGGDCVKACDPAFLGNGVCDAECNIEELNNDHGDCVICGTNFEKVRGVCYQTVWVSTPDSLSANVVDSNEDLKTRTVKKVPVADGWQSIPGATWVWDTTAGQGTFAFVEYPSIPTGLHGHILSAEVTVAVDENYKLIVNDHVVTPKAGDWSPAPITYDIKPYLIYDNVKPNILRFDVTNLSGPGGLAYKLELTLTSAAVSFLEVASTVSCLPGQDFVNGACQCKAGYAQVNGGACYQSVWVSTANSLSANVTPLNSDLKTRKVSTPSIAGGWQSVPGATWVWDATAGQGVFAFVEYVSIPTALRGHISSAKVTASVDENYKLIVNDQVITPKAGDWFLAPISYDVTQYLIYDDTKPNVLRFDVTNLSGPGGLAYKLELTITKCSSVQKEVNGVCQCNANNSPVGDGCYQSVWVSTANSLSANVTPLNSDLKTRKVSTPAIAGGWQSVPGATWVWDATAGQGVFAFVEYVSIPTALRGHISSAKVTASVDENYKLIVNDQVITPKAGDWFLAPITYDVTPYLIYDDTKPNVLRFDVTNLSGPGGLAYRLDLVINKCTTGQVEVNGVCQCNSDSAPVGDGCYRSVWVSTANSLSANVTPLNSDLKTRKVSTPAIAGGWQSVPGATWVWDATAGQGVFAFVEYVSIPTALRGHISSAKVTASVDENYKLIVNDQVITPKAGDWFLAPITYDVTPYLIYDDTKPNVLRFDVTNLSGPGGLAYRLDLVINKCTSSQVEVNGVCQCKSDSIAFGNDCYQSVWVSTANSLSANVTPLNSDLKTRKVTTPSIAGGWQSVPGATWVWDATAGQGVFAFVEYVSIPTALRRHISSAKVTASVDENYKLIVNDQVITPKAGDWFLAPISYDVTPYLIYDDTKPNVLRFDVTNLSGPGGLAYRLDLVINKCTSSQVEVNGVCQCKSDSIAFGNDCYQSVWVSTANSLSANVTPLNSDLKTRKVTTPSIAGGWQSVPGAIWVWDATAGQGVFAFVEYVSIPTALRGHIGSAKVTASVDENYKLIVNDQVITPKAGDWFLAPITYDVTPYLIYDDSKPNVLRFDVTNLSGPGGLAYRLDLVINKCTSSQIEVNGICQCKSDSIRFGNDCYQSVWVSTANSLSANVTPLNSDLKTRKVTTPAIAGGWQSVPGATWVWDATAGQGIFAFVEYVSIPTALRRHISSAKVTASVDENYKLIVNDQVITPKAGDWFLAPISYDVTPYLIYDDTKPNILRFDVTNLSGPGGLAYKLELTISKCTLGQVEVNGICQCKPDSTPFGNDCYQSLWVSTANSLSANVTPLNSDLKTRKVSTPSIAGGWQSVPGATWVWDATAGQGVFAFVEYVSIPTALRRHISSAKVTASVDENYKLIFNDQVITPKAGDWFLAPISYDVTPYLIYDNTNPNILRFDVTNLSGPGGLAYRLELTISKCTLGQVEVNGVCQCKPDSTPFGNDCYQSVWVSTANSLSANVATPSTSLQTRKVTTPSIAGGWQSVPGATWVWDSTAGQGVFAFVEYVSIPTALRGHISSAKVTASVDENYKLIVNDQVITPKAGDWFLAPITYDVTPYLIYDDSKPNILRFDVTNLSGPGGLAYRLDLVINRCNYGTVEVNGVCQCKPNHVASGDACYQTLWVSTANSLSANVTPLSADLKTRTVKTVPIAGGWQSVPDATWVWDATAAQGTFAFVEYIGVPTALIDRVTSAKVTVSVDENYKLIFNDQVVTPKAGDWFLAPIVYDVTPYLIYDDYRPNVLRFDATNLSGPGGLAYRFDLTISKCAARQEEVAGVCRCKAGFQANGSGCYQTVWVSNVNSLSANVATPSTSLQTRKVATPSIAGGWQSVPDATWVWDATAGQGTFAFVEYVSIPAALQNHIASAKVTASVDEKYKLLVNDQVITPSAGDWWAAPITYDVTQYLKYDDASKNILRFDVTNLSGPGGLAYKLELTLK